MTAAALTDALEVDDLTVTLGGRRVLDSVSCRVPAGTVCGLIGSNGAGKTTLLRAVLGLVRPDAGRVVVAGRPAGGRARPEVGYVPQSIGLDPDAPLRARDLVALGVDGHRVGLRRPSAWRMPVVDEALAAVGATGFADARVGRLSGGQAQRVLIAHALVARPPLLLLDEPLANLDIRAANEVVELLGRLADEQGIGVLLSAHDMNPLLPVMSQVVYLAGGRAAAGPTDQVVTTEVLSRLYAGPVEVVRAAGRVVVVAGDAVDPCDPCG